MGHAIYGKGTDSQTPVNLIFGANNQLLKSSLYGALNSWEFCNGVSGSGEAKTFSREELNNALAKVQYMKDESPDDYRDKRQHSELDLMGFLTQSMKAKALPNPSTETWETATEKVEVWLLALLSQDDDYNLIEFE